MSDGRRGPDGAHLEALARHPVVVMATVQPDGRPHLSLVRPWVHDGVAEVTLTDQRVKTRNLRANPRAAFLAVGDGWERFVVADGRAELSPVSTEPGDATGQRLADLYRAVAGEHPEWDDYHRAMVADRRLVASITLDHTYAGGTHT
ncbi:MAG: PPOX class F420-dependent oxidoreductase [Acidimicrobiales bacterium]